MIVFQKTGIKFYALFLALFVCPNLFSQTNAPSIQTGVSFQWSDTQSVNSDPATIQSITVNGLVYTDIISGIPTSYQLTQLGPTGNAANNIRLNGGFTETTSASATWDASALSAFQDLNLNHYFEANGNGANICDDFLAESTTNAQRQTISYSPGIAATSSAIVAVTERNANNCFHIEVFGTPAGGGATQSLGETFVNQTGTQWGHGGLGVGNTSGTTNPPNTGSDYWLANRVIENGGTIGIALFYLDDLAPINSTITSVQLTAATSDHGDGKLFIISLPDSDGDGLSDPDDLDDDDDGILDIDEANGNFPDGDEDADGIPNWNDTVDNGTGDGSITNYTDSNGDGVPDVYDFDGDGIPNHKDLDSDNDGCFDALEGGDAIVLGEVDINGVLDGAIDPTTGVPDNVDVNNGQTIGNSQDTSAFDTNGQCDQDNDGVLDINDACQGFDDSVDADSDSIPDACDLDNDNDGILDTDEGLCTTGDLTGTWTETTAGVLYEATAGTTDIDVSFTFAGNAGFDISGGTYVDGNFNPAGTFWDEALANNTSFQGRWNWDTTFDGVYDDIDLPSDDKGTGTMTITFSQPVVNPIINFDRLGGWAQDTGTDPVISNSVQFTLTTSGATLTRLSGTDDFDVTATTIQKTSDINVIGNSESSQSPIAGTASGSVKIYGTFTTLTFDFTGVGVEGNGRDEVEMILSGICPSLDTDNDGTPDYLDTDSDNDGCFDALEGDGGILASQLDGSGAIDIATNGVDVNGVPNDASGGQVDVSSTDSGVQGLQCQADLSLTKTVNIATPRIGDTIIFTITLTSDGPSNTTGVQVQDLLPTGIIYDAGNSVIPPSTTYDDATGIWDLSSLTIENNDVFVLQIAGIITPACGEITNTAEIINSNKLDPDSIVNNNQ